MGVEHSDVVNSETTPDQIKTIVRSLIRSATIAPIGMPTMRMRAGIEVTMPISISLILRSFRKTGR